MMRFSSIGGRKIAVIALFCVLWSVIHLPCYAQSPENSSLSQNGTAGATIQPGKPEPAQELFLSLGNGDIMYFRSLLEAGANPNTTLPDTGKTLLMVAQRADIVALLLKFGADPGLVDHQGATALHYAVAAGDALQMIPLLLEKGASINAKAYGMSQQTPLLVAAKLYFQGHDPIKCAKVMHLLAKHGAEVNTADESGYTVLINAVVNDKPDLVRLMIELGADLEIKAKDGLSALDWAQELGFVDIVELLEASLQ